MKIVNATLLFLLICMTSYSQLTRTGSFVAADSSTYPITGDVTVTENSGVMTVVFETNFSTIQGFVLEVFLSKTGILDTNTDLKISTMPLDSGSPFMSPITGMRSFTVPAGTSISDFDHVLVQCTSANVLWGNVSLSSIQGPTMTRSGNFIADSNTYPISGDVTVTEDAAGVLTVVFESNFTTIQGFKLEVFLSKSNTLNTFTDQKISLLPLDDGSAFMSPITGMRTFTASPGTSIYDFDNVIVQCTSANALWGHANLCESDLDILDIVRSPTTFKAEQHITSSALITSGYDIGYEASDYVELENGFEVSSSTNFIANTGQGYGCVIE